MQCVPNLCLQANYSIAATHLVSAAFGLQLWRTQLPLDHLWEVMGYDAGAQPVITVADATLVLVSAAGIMQGVMNVVRVFEKRVHLGEHDRGYKQVGWSAAVLQLVLLLGACWLGAWSVAVAGGQQEGSVAVWGQGAWAAVKPRWLAGGDVEPGALQCRCDHTLCEVTRHPLCSHLCLSLLHCLLYSMKQIQGLAV